MRSSREGVKGKIPPITNVMEAMVGLSWNAFTVLAVVCRRGGSVHWGAAQKEMSPQV